MKSSFLILLILLGVWVGGQAQTLKGVVTDEAGNPLRGVNITVSGTKTIGTSSGAQGGFSIACHPGDTLLFSHIGFESSRLHVYGKYLKKTDQTLSVKLVPKFIPLKQVEITGKRDRSFRYLLDFDIIQGNILTLEIKGRKKILVLSDTSDNTFWRCLLPKHTWSSNKLNRDFMGNVYLQSDDSLYQLNVDTRVCEILPGVHQDRFHQVMDPCVGKTSDGILIRNYGEYNQSVSVWLANRKGREKIYEQNDKLALKYCQELDGKNTFHAGLGFEVSSPEMASSHPSSLYQKHQIRGASSEFVKQIMSKPISVESFCINDTIFIFDNTTNRMFIFNKKGEQLKVCRIRFNNNDFLQKYIVDEHTNMAYGVFRNKSGIYLIAVDRNSGEAIGTMQRIDMYFYEKVRLLENKAIYMKYDHVANSRSIIMTQL